MSARITRWCRPSDDAGMTMTDVMVAMAITSMIAAIVSTSLVSLYNVVSDTVRTDDTYAQLGVAYQRLDQQIRHAYDISAPGPAADGSPSVEYLTRDSAGAWTCNQLRLTDQQLKARSWPMTATAPTGGWRILASGLSGPTTADPAPAASAPAGQVLNFPGTGPGTGLTAAGYGPLHLRVRLTATAAEAKGTTRRENTMTFVAANSALDRHQPTLCSAGRTTT
jgi:type II secretory pathway pseudopilin PulG